MTVAFSASKTRVREFFAAIKDGAPIQPDGGWSLLDMLTLSGVLHAAMMTHPPQWAGGNAVADLDAEKREAVETTHEQETVEAVRFIAAIALDILDDREPNLPISGDKIAGVLAVGADGMPRVQLHQGGVQ